MTNLNVPGLGTFDDVAAYVDGVGNAARIAARALARADTAAKNAALTEMAEAIRRDEARLLAANAEYCFFLSASTSASASSCLLTAATWTR